MEKKIHSWNLQLHATAEYPKLSKTHENVTLIVD